MLYVNNHHAHPIELSVITPYYMYMKNIAEATVKDIPLLTQRKFIGDFIGLLNSIGVDPKMHDLTMLLNNLSDPGEYGGEATIFIPSNTVVSLILDSARKAVKIG